MIFRLMKSSSIHSEQFNFSFSFLSDWVTRKTPFLLLKRGNRKWWPELNLLFGCWCSRNESKVHCRCGAESLRSTISSAAAGTSFSVSESWKVNGRRRLQQRPVKVCEPQRPKLPDPGNATHFCLEIMSVMATIVPCLGSKKTPTGRLF